MEANASAESCHLQAHPFGHGPPVGIVVVVLQNHHGGDHGHPHDDHYTGKVLTWEGETLSLSTIYTLRVRRRRGFLPMRGTESEVAGMISATSSMKTVRDSRTVIPAGQTGGRREPHFC